MTSLLDSRPSAFFSDDRVYRYALWRRWDDTLPQCLFVGLNPSTADETVDDPTIRRCVGFARRFGCGSLAMANLFAFRATRPLDLQRADDPVGPENDLWLRTLRSAAEVCVAAWGFHGGYRRRDVEVLRLLDANGYGPRGFGDVRCLGLTAAGFPRHPLYLRSTAPLVPFPLRGSR